MDEPTPNLLNALFKFHPRDGHTPKENFLSEAFAYLLITDTEVCDAWLSLVLGSKTLCTKHNISTRKAEQDEHSSFFPDMLVEAVLSDARKVTIYSEHKWDSNCDPKQIRRYLRGTEGRGADVCLVFICATARQKREALGCDERIKGKVFLWEEVFTALQNLPQKPDQLEQFLEFMKTHGLSPGKPVTVETMVAFIQGSPLEQSLERLANKLLEEFNWSALPMRYRGSPTVTNKWGRIAIEFATEAWKPTVTVGFLTNERDHRVSFVNAGRGIDLLLRLEAAPRDQQNITSAMKVLGEKRQQLVTESGSALLKGETGNGNNHSLLIVRSCLADFVQSGQTEVEQLELIYKRLISWLEILFSDGLLEKALQKSGLDSGM